MGDSFIRYTTRGESTESSINITSVWGGFTELTGVPASNRSEVVSIGGASFVQNFDHWFTYKVVLPPLSRASYPNNWAAAQQLVAHLSVGGLFAFELDTSLTSNTTAVSDTTASQTTIVVNDTTGVGANEFIFLEDYNDPTKWEINRVSSVGGATITFTNNLRYSYAAGSVVRHWEYFPQCRPVKEIKFSERKGGEGVQLYDLEFTFRTVRE